MSFVSLTFRNHIYLALDGLNLQTNTNNALTRRIPPLRYKAIQALKTVAKQISNPGN